MNKLLLPIVLIAGLGLIGGGYYMSTQAQRAVTNTNTSRANSNANLPASDTGQNVGANTPANANENNNVNRNTNANTNANTNLNTNTNSNTPNETGSTPTYTLSQVAAHNTASSCWTAIRGTVYDLTDWIGKHPGGEANILKLCGTDGTDFFVGKHGGSPPQENRLAVYEIGVVKQ